MCVLHSFFVFKIFFCEIQTEKQNTKESFFDFYHFLKRSTKIRFMFVFCFFISKQEKTKTTFGLDFCFKLQSHQYFHSHRNNKTAIVIGPFFSFFHFEKTKTNKKTRVFKNYNEKHFFIRFQYLIEEDDKK